MLFFRLTIATLALPILALPAAAASIGLYGHGPSDNSSIIAGWTWTAPTPYLEIPTNWTPVACNSAAVSQCLADIDVSALVPTGATHAMIKVKSKAWVRGGTSETDYALVHGASWQPSSVMNHFFHTEEMEGPSNIFNGERRRVNFNDAIVPITSGHIQIQIGRQIQGNSVIEVAIYLEGYLS